MNGEQFVAFCCIMILLVVVAVTSAATANHVRHIDHRQDRAAHCTHGESSVMAYVDTDGTVHQFPAHKTGCQP